MAEQCVHIVHGGRGNNYRCGNRHKVVIDGKPYCNVHDPRKVAERRAAQEQEARRKWERHICDVEGGALLRDLAPAEPAAGAAALRALVTACRPFAALAPAFAAMGGEAQRRDDTEVYRAHWDNADPDGKAITNGDFRAVAATLAQLEAAR